MAGAGALVVVGSLAIDTIETAQGGRATEVLGGAATYFAVAASFFAPVQIVGVVGDDFPRAELDWFQRRGIDLAGLEVRPGRSMRWTGRYHEDMNIRDTLSFEANVFDGYSPTLPASYCDAPYVFLGNIAPSLQARVLDQVRAPKLIGADTMNFYIEGARGDLEMLLKRVPLLIINDEEARMISGERNMVRAARKILELGPTSLMIKRGEYGVLYFSGETIFSAPAYPLEEVFDPTGAGDTFAGGVMGYLAASGDTSPAGIRKAIIYGSVVASFTVEAFSLERLRTLSRDDIERRYRQFVSLTSFDVPLMPQLSIVVPVYNEAPNAEALVAELRATIDRLPQTSEIVLVDDGSNDDTFARLVDAAGDDARIHLVRLMRNFGQTAALAAGLDHASGAIIVTMDGDLQNDPADIPRLLAMIDAGYDVVTGWRRDRKDPFLSRRLPSLIANAIIGTTTNVAIHDHGCGLKAFRADIAKQLKLYGEMHRFITAIAGDLGAAVTEIPVNHRPRLRGQSKYGISRTVRVVLDLLTIKFLAGFSTRPIHVFGTFGLITMLTGLLITGVLGLEKIFLGMELAGRPLLLLGILLVLGGVQLVTLGLLGEMLARTYHESQGKPIYRLREVRTGMPGKKAI